MLNLELDVFLSCRTLCCQALPAPLSSSFSAAAAAVTAYLLWSRLIA